MVTRTRPHVRRMAVAVAVTLGVGIATLSGPSSADVTNIGGQAFGERDSLTEPLRVEVAVRRPGGDVVVPPTAAGGVEQDALEAVVLPQRPALLPRPRG